MPSAHLAEEQVKPTSPFQSHGCGTSHGGSPQPTDFHSRKLVDIPNYDSRRKAFLRIQCCAVLKLKFADLGGGSAAARRRFIGRGTTRFLRKHRYPVQPCSTSIAGSRGCPSKAASCRRTPLEPVHSPCTGALPLDPRTPSRPLPRSPGYFAASPKSSAISAGSSADSTGLHENFPHAVTAG